MYDKHGIPRQLPQKSTNKFSHVYSIAFTVEFDMPEGEDVTQPDLIAGCLKRIADITANDEWLEAAGTRRFHRLVKNELWQDSKFCLRIKSMTLTC